MKSLLSFLAFLLIFQITDAQKLRDRPEISIHTKFLLELAPKDSSKFDYKILKTEPFSADINMDSSVLVLHDTLKTNKVQGIFTTGIFGNKTATLWFIKTENDSPLDYQLFIRQKGKGRLKETSTLPISKLPNVEIWQDQIISLKISDFTKISF